METAPTTCVREAAPAFDLDPTHEITLPRQPAGPRLVDSKERGVDLSACALDLARPPREARPEEVARGREALARGRAQLAAGKWPRALFAYQEAESLLGGTWEVVVGLGRCKMALGEVDEGADLMIDALHRAGHAAARCAVYEHLGHAYATRGDLTEATYYFKRAAAEAEPEPLDDDDLESLLVLESDVVAKGPLDLWYGDDE